MLTSEDPRFGQATLTDCDREPIHIPGSIQPHGCLLSLDLEHRRVVQYAGDLQRLLGSSCQSPLGETLEALVGPSSAAQIWRAHSAAQPRPLPMRSHGVEITTPLGPLDCLLHRQGERLILEFLPSLQAETEDALTLVQSMLAALEETVSVQSFCDTAVEQLRAATGFDRVMIYRFQEAGDGVVEAEARAPEMESFLDLHYPESDIPKQARQLYLRNWVRAIPDAAYTPAPLIPERDPQAEAPLDLSFAALRSVSPLHTRYLQNMGVAASMSLSIVLRGKLWGLIACHHRTPYRLARAIQSACEMFAQTFSLQLGAKLEAEMLEYRLRQRAVHQQLVARLAGVDSLSEGMIRYRPNLLNLIEAEGVAVCINGEIAEAGRTPGRDALHELMVLLRDTNTDGVFACDRLQEMFPAWGHGRDAAGVLALSVSRTPQDWVFWFRPEVIETVTWAGNPHKAVELASGGQLTPRASFAAWSETVRGRSKPWQSWEVEGAQALRVSVLEVVLRRIDQLARERQEANQRQALLVAELDHRVKNVLANVQALMRHTRRSNTSLDGYVDGLERRLKAMAYVQNLLSAGRWRGAQLHRLIEDQLRPFELDPSQLRISGEPLELAPKAALSLSMVLHELSTNAAKYGSLSRETGKLAVSWQAAGEMLHLTWRESDGPAVAEPEHRGFGRTLIERSLAYELRGTVALRFAPSGVECDIAIPAHFVLAGAAEPETAPARPAPSIPAHTAAKVLLVEDSIVTALDTAETIRSWGFEVIGPCGGVDEAMALIAEQAPTVAVLDINLGEEDSFPLADALRQRGIPFLFLSAYEARAILPPRFAEAVCLTKPFVPEQLSAALSRVLAG